MGLDHTAPVVKFPPHSLVALRPRLSASQRQGRLLIPPMEVSSQEKRSSNKMVSSMPQPSAGVEGRGGGGGVN